MGFPKTDVEMVDTPRHLQFGHIRGGRLDEADLPSGKFCQVGEFEIEAEDKELLSEEFGQSDDHVPAKFTLTLTWTIAWDVLESLFAR